MTGLICIEVERKKIEMITCRFKNALLIDDNHIDNMINQRILTNYSIAENIISSLSAFEALAYLNQHLQDENIFPDLIFLDIRMPEMDGFQFLEAFEKLNAPFKSRTKIYMLSSSLDPTDQRRVLECKYVLRFIGKPLTSSHLHNI